MLTGVAVAARHHGDCSGEETVIFQQAGRYGQPTMVLKGRKEDGGRVREDGGRVREHEGG